MVIVRPETVIGWHRRGSGFSGHGSPARKPGRPPVSREIRYLVRRMSRKNTRWGAPRIHGELLKLGFSISQAAVSKYMARYPSPPSQSWRTFLSNHADYLASIDFFVVPTATFHLPVRVHRAPPRAPPDRAFRCHGEPDDGVGRTADPRGIPVGHGAAAPDPRPGRRIRAIVPLDRDGDGPWKRSSRRHGARGKIRNVERLIGSVRRECLDHSIILNERHLRRILGSYFDYYHGSRTPLVARQDTPGGRPVQPAGSGTVVSCPRSAVCIIVTNASRPDHVSLPFIPSIAETLGILHHHRIPFPACIRSSKSSRTARRSTQKFLPCDSR